MSKMYRNMNSALVVDAGRRDFDFYEIPLARLTSSHGSFMQTDQMQVGQVAFIVKSPRNAKFDFAVKSISLIYNREFERIAKNYKQNIMFRRRESYLAEGIDTGAFRLRV